jgi:LDH2 family malate/lactate/ureidoglycolate dehydrogenase
VIVAMRPDLLGPTDAFRRNVAACAETIRATRPVPGGAPVRMPFDRSRAERARRLREGAAEVEDPIVRALRGMVEDRGCFARQRHTRDLRACRARPRI